MRVVSSMERRRMRKSRHLDRRLIMAGCRFSIAGVTATTDPAVSASVMSAYQSIVAAVTNLPPANVISELQTGIPPELRESLIGSPEMLFTMTETPSWFTELPTGVQSYVAGQGSTVRSLLSSFGFTNLEGLATVSVTTNTDPTNTNQSPSATTETDSAESTDAETDSEQTTTTTAETQTTTTAASTTETESESQSTTTPSRSSSSSANAASASNTSTTSNPASKPTGAIAASMAGVVGILGVAIIL